MTNEQVSIAVRVSALEGVVRRQRLMILALACTFFFVGFSPTTPKEVAAERFVLIDSSGTERAVLGMDQGRGAIPRVPGPRLELLDESGSAAVVLASGVNALGTHVQGLYVHDGEHSLVSLGTVDLDASLRLAGFVKGSEAETSSLDLSAGGGGKASLSGSAEHVRMLLQVSAKDGPRFSLSSKIGQIVHVVP